MSEPRQRLMGAVLGLAFIVTGQGCGGEQKAPPTTTVAPAPPVVPTTSIAPVQPSSAPATPPAAAPSPASAAGKPRKLPTVRIEQGGDLVAISNWRWKDEAERQMTGDLRLKKGPIASLSFAFIGDQKKTASRCPGPKQDCTIAMVSGVLPGSLFRAEDKVTTIDLPPAGGIGRLGVPQVADMTTAERLVIDVVALPDVVLPPGQPAWVAPLATACEQGSIGDCATLATAYRTGKSEHGSIKPDDTLAERFSQQMVDTGVVVCATGRSDACFEVGRAYVTGEGVAADHDRGVAFVQKACALGSQEACNWQRANPAMVAQPR